MEPVLVSPDVSSAIVKAELQACLDYPMSFCQIAMDPQDGRLFSASMTSLPLTGMNNRFVFSFDCSNYKLWPPLIRMVDPNTGELDVFNAYPKGRDSLFNNHNHRPTICKEFNRGAYDFYKGIHPDWKLPTGPGSSFNWAKSIPLLDNLAAMLFHFWKKLNTPGYVTGRMLVN